MVVMPPPTHFRSVLVSNHGRCPLTGGDVRSVVSTVFCLKELSADREKLTTYKTKQLNSALRRVLHYSEGVTINITSDMWFREDDDGIPYKCPSLRRRWDEYKKRREYIAGAEAMEPIMQQFLRLLRTPRASLPNIV